MLIFYHNLVLFKIYYDLLICWIYGAIDINIFTITWPGSNFTDTRIYNHLAILSYFYYEYLQQDGRVQGKNRNGILLWLGYFCGTLSDPWPVDHSQSLLQFRHLLVSRSNTHHGRAALVPHPTHVHVLAHRIKDLHERKSNAEARTQMIRYLVKRRSRAVDVASQGRPRVWMTGGWLVGWESGLDENLNVTDLIS